MFPLLWSHPNHSGHEFEYLNLNCLKMLTNNSKNIDQSLNLRMVHSSFLSFLIFISKYWTSSSSFLQVSSSIFLFRLMSLLLLPEVTNGNEDSRTDVTSRGVDPRMWGSVSGGPSITWIPL